MSWARPSWRDIPDVVRESETEYPDEMPEIQTIGHAAMRVLPAAQLSATVSKHTESPIETMLAVAILTNNPDVELRAYASGFAPEWTLIPQYPFLGYRIDFALRNVDGRMFFVECDGHDFHTSPEQVERDEKRDRRIQAAGYRVFRFTGSEINHSPVACENMLPLKPWRRG